MSNSRFSKNLMLYFIGIVTTKAVPYLLIPLYTRYIPEDKYGYFDYTMTYILLLVPLLYQSIWEAVLRFAIEEKDINNKRKIINIAIVYSLGCTILFLGVFYLIDSLYFVKYSSYIILLGIFQALGSIWQFSARALEQNLLYVKAGIYAAILNIFSNILLIVVFKLDIESLYIANIINYLILVIVIESKIKLLRISIKKFDIKILKSMLKYSFPLALNQVSWWLLGTINRTIISNKLGFEANGIYGIAYKISTVITLITSVYNMAWQEEAFHIHNDKDKEEKSSESLNLLIRLLLSGNIILVPIIGAFYKLFIHGNYIKGIKIIPIMLLAASINPIAIQFGHVFLANKKSNYLFNTTLIGASINVLFVFLLINQIELYAAAIGTLLGAIANLFIRNIVSKKFINLRIQFNKNIILLLYYIVVLFVYYFAPNKFNILTLFVGLLFTIYINRQLIQNIYNYIFKIIRSR
ncbi:MAG: oligosaccharide flippase family protein [Tissierellia bacterium]|nr:oligosaccharide flippase family protein [Tissierellia bacterium]